jgi:hypothetical protein
VGCDDLAHDWDKKFSNRNITFKVIFVKEWGTEPGSEDNPPGREQERE